MAHWSRRPRRLTHTSYTNSRSLEREASSVSHTYAQSISGHGTGSGVASKCVLIARLSSMCACVLLRCVVGEGALFSGTRAASIRARVPVRLLALTESSFQKVMHVHPHFAEKIMFLNAERQKRMEEKAMGGAGRAAAAAAAAGGVDPLGGGVAGFTARPLRGGGGGGGGASHAHAHHAHSEVSHVGTANTSVNHLASNDVRVVAASASPQPSPHGHHPRKSHGGGGVGGNDHATPRPGQSRGGTGADSTAVTPRGAQSRNLAQAAQPPARKNILHPGQPTGLEGKVKQLLAAEREREESRRPPLSAATFTAVSGGASQQLGPQEPSPAAPPLLPLGQASPALPALAVAVRTPSGSPVAGLGTRASLGGGGGGGGGGSGDHADLASSAVVVPSNSSSSASPPMLLLQGSPAAHERSLHTGGAPPGSINTDDPIVPSVLNPLSPSSKGGAAAAAAALAASGGLQGDSASSSSDQASGPALVRVSTSLLLNPGRASLHQLPPQPSLPLSALPPAVSAAHAVASRRLPLASLRSSPSSPYDDDDDAGRSPSALHRIPSIYATHGPAHSSVVGALGYPLASAGSSYPTSFSGAAIMGGGAMGSDPASVPFPGHAASSAIMDGRSNGGSLSARGNNSRPTSASTRQQHGHMPTVAAAATAATAALSPTNKQMSKKPSQR